MKKGTNVVCKNCGTEYVWGKKRKLSGGQNIAFYLCYFFDFLSKKRPILRKKISLVN